ncbi:MAG TPA: sugar phosphate isomerase/epimerase [Tepidisphaeraceae bacterium]|jgi:sugar phosphate isomerase/epimerase
MKFAFSTISCPTWDVPTILSRAREYGYDGVEIRGFLDEPNLTRVNLFSETDAIRDAFAQAGVQIACLASSVAMTANKRRNKLLADEVRTYVDTAVQVGCPMVKIFDTQVWPGQSRASAGVILGDWLVPLGDYAAERDVLIVVENQLSFRSAKEMWAILDRLSHPSIAAAWDVFNAATIGESPYLSVPTLNSRIQYTQVKDAKLGSLGATYCKLGEGDVPVKKFLLRLRGIGYTGWITVEWEKAWLPGLAEPEEILPDALKKLKEWMKLGVEEEAEAAPAAAKK